MRKQHRRKIEAKFVELVRTGYFVLHKDGSVLNTKTGKLCGIGGTPDVYKNLGYGPRTNRLLIGIHRLMWLVFRGPIPFGMEINHKNGRKHDNRLKNLELISSSGNKKHAYATGLGGPGEGRYNAKLYDEDVLKMRRLRKKGRTYAYLAAKFGVSESTAYRVTHGGWKHVA